MAINQTAQTGPQTERELFEAQALRHSEQDKRVIWGAFERLSQRPGGASAEDLADPSVSLEALKEALRAQALAARARWDQLGASDPEETAFFQRESVGAPALERCVDGLRIAARLHGYPGALSAAEALFEIPWGARCSDALRVMVDLALSNQAWGGSSAAKARNIEALSASAIWGPSAWNRAQGEPISAGASVERYRDARLCSKLLALAVKAPKSAGCAAGLALRALGLSRSGQSSSAWRSAGKTVGEELRGARARPEALGRELTDLFPCEFWLGVSQGRALSGARAAQAREGVARMAIERLEPNGEREAVIESLRADAWMSLERSGIQAFERLYPGGAQALREAIEKEVSGGAIARVYASKERLSEALARPSGAWARAAFPGDPSAWTGPGMAVAFQAAAALLEAGELKAQVGAAKRSKKGARARL